jgi:SAM-dependent methyltransferase
MREKTWDETWKDTESLPTYRKFSYNFIKSELKSILRGIDLPKTARIIDIGHGSGTTLNFFREFGFQGSIGIDNSPSSIQLSERLYGFRKNIDIFQMDAMMMSYKDKNFDLVFSNGLLEHHNNWMLDKIVSEMCRVANRYVLLFQPDPSSFFGKIIRYIVNNKIIFDGEAENNYSEKDFIGFFSKHGFKLFESGRYGLGGIYLLFIRA